MGSRTRYVVVGTILLGILATVAMAHGFGWIWVQLDLDDMPLLGRELSLTRAIAGVIGLGAIVFVLKHNRTFTLANEVVDELSKVSWPTREETGNATVVVIVTVLVCSVYLGVFDAVWMALTNWMLGIQSGVPS